MSKDNKVPMSKQDLLNRLHKQYEALTGPESEKFLKATGATFGDIQEIKADIAQLEREIMMERISRN